MSCPRGKARRTGAPTHPTTYTNGCNTTYPQTLFREDKKPTHQFNTLDAKVTNPHTPFTYQPTEATNLYAHAAQPKHIKPVI